MVTLATRRLIDAAAKLKPADRALLNLWVNRGLDDERLAELTGMPTEALRARRENIVARLAADLGLPASDVRAAIDQISPDDEALHPPDSNGAAGAAPDRDGAAAVTAAAEHGDPTDSAVKPPHRRRRWLGLAALAVIAVVMIVIVTGARSSSPPSHRAAEMTTAPPTATQAPTAATTVPTPGPVPLTGLPGGRFSASGSVKLSGPVGLLRLNLRVKGLPLAHAGHYEAWLYNSVLDSRPLARMRYGHHRLAARLLAGARRYRWIDISFQPVGTVNHSGESVLRASNPAHTTMARLRKRSARSRHRLRPAAKVSAAHPPRPARHHLRAARHRGDGNHRPPPSSRGAGRRSK